MGVGEVKNYKQLASVNVNVIRSAVCGLTVMEVRILSSHKHWKTLVLSFLISNFKGVALRSLRKTRVMRDAYSQV